MLNPFVSSVVYQAEMLISYIFYSNIAEKRNKPAWILIIGFILFELGSFANLYFGNNVFLNISFSVLIHFLFSLICFHIHMRAGLFFAAVLMALSFALEVVMIFFVSALTQSQPKDYNADLLLFVLECPVSKILYFIIALVLSKVLKPSRQDKRLAGNMLLYPAATALCLVGFFFVCMEEQIGPNGQFLVSVISLTMFFTTILLVLTYQHQIEKDSEYYRVQTELSKLQIEKSYYDILEQQNHELMMYAHDAKNHLAVMQSLNSDPQIRGYISKLSEQLADYSKNCHSGNKLLDVMMDKYTLECGHYGIAFDYDVKLCNLCCLEEIDLVAVLGNLMDNAVSAAEQSQAKSISLVTSKRNAYSILIITNSCDTPPKHNGVKLISSKEDQLFHGFGMQSVTKVLKKYDGDFEWDYNPEKREFTATAIMKAKT